MTSKNTFKSATPLFACTTSNRETSEMRPWRRNISDIPRLRLPFSESDAVHLPFFRLLVPQKCATVFQQTCALYTVHCALCTVHLSTLIYLQVNMWGEMDYTLWPSSSTTNSIPSIFTHCASDLDKSLDLKLDKWINPIRTLFTDCASSNCIFLILFWDHLYTMWGERDQTHQQFSQTVHPHSSLCIFASQ